MTYETADRLVGNIVTLLEIAGSDTTNLVKGWREKPKAATLYEEIGNAEYIQTHRFGGEFSMLERNLFHAAYRIADAIAHAENY